MVINTRARNVRFFFGSVYINDIQVGVKVHMVKEPNVAWSWGKHLLKQVCIKWVLLCRFT